MSLKVKEKHTTDTSWKFPVTIKYLEQASNGLVFVPLDEERLDPNFLEQLKHWMKRVRTKQKKIKTEIPIDNFRQLNINKSKMVILMNMKTISPVYFIIYDNKSDWFDGEIIVGNNRDENIKIGGNHLNKYGDNILKPRDVLMMAKGPKIAFASDLAEMGLHAPWIRNRKRCCRCNEKQSKLKAKLKLCSGCGKLYYCNKHCQKIHWKNQHRYECYTLQ